MFHWPFVSCAPQMASVSALFLLVLLPSVTGDSMIVTYGQPSNFSSSTPFSADSWDSCVVHCYQLSSCVLAYSPVSPVNCQIFTVNQVWEVTKLNSSEQKLVAFKVTNEGTCPIGNNAPTFGNGTNYGFSSTATANYSYEINYASDDKWTFQYQVFLVCPANWTTFSRPLTTWCIRVFGGPDQLYKWAEALSYCATYNSTLSGLETIAERDFAADTALTLLGDNYPNFAGFWVSGIRKPECYSEDWQSFPECSNSILQFNYTDNYLTNYAGYTWDPNQPDRNASKVWQNCIQIWIRNQATYPNWTYSTQGNGNADDNVCDEDTYTGLVLRGMVCGKLPEVPLGA